MVYIYGMIDYEVLMKWIKEAVERARSLYDPVNGLGVIDGLNIIKNDVNKIINALQSIGNDRLLTLPSNPPNLDISLSSLRDALKPREVK